MNAWRAFTSNILATVAAALCLVMSATASAFPDRAIVLVVPYPAGGITDAMGRILANGLSRRLGQTVVVENRGGGGTVIGAGMVARAAPDGYTLLITSNSTFTLNPALNSGLPYDSLKSFESLGTLGSTPLVLLANPSLPVSTVKELVSLAKAHPGQLGYASFGIGTSPHFAGEMLKAMADVDITHVPYRGEGPALQDLVGGQVGVGFSTIATAIPQIRAGKLKAIAVTSAKPTASMPNVPSIAQSGYPGYEMVPWFALVAPLGLPGDVATVLNRALVESLADRTVRGELEAIGLDVDYQAPAAYVETVNKELPRMRAYAHKANIRVD